MGIQGHLVKAGLCIWFVAFLSACSTSSAPVPSSVSETAQASSTIGESKTGNVKQSLSKPSSVQKHTLLPGQDSTENDYRIGVDDIVQINVWRNPELSVTVPVRPDGKISIPLVGDVKAGGNTPMQVASIVEKKLEKYVRNPNVAVILTELRSHEFLSRVRVTGAVRNPISMPFRQGMTVLDAVLGAGGVNEFAAANRTKLYRKNGDQTQIFKIKLDRLLNKGDLKTNLVLERGDIITVPLRLF